MLRCLGQSPPWSRWEGGSNQQGFSLPVYNGPEVFRKGFFCFSLWLPSTSLMASGTGCSWKIVDRV